MDPFQTAFEVTGSRVQANYRPLTTEQPRACRKLGPQHRPGSTGVELSEHSDSTELQRNVKLGRALVRIRDAVGES